MALLSSKLDWPLANPLWAAILNPIIAIKLLQGKATSDISLIDGVTVINHGLQRMPIGWFITDINSSVSVYRSAPFTSTSLTLTSSAAAKVSLWVF